MQTRIKFKQRKWYNSSKHFRINKKSNKFNE